MGIRWNRLLKNVMLVVGSLFCLLQLGCASQATSSDKALDRQIEKQPEANNPQEILKRAAAAFSHAPGLSNDQKDKLADVYVKTYFEAMEIRKEIGKSKSLLFERVADSETDSRELEKLKQKIVDLDQRRLTVMFKALADVQAIVGYGADKKEIYKHLRDFEMLHGGGHVTMD